MSARRQRGFTLLEVTIAVAITAVMAAMALGAFRRAAEARDLTDAQEERFAGARVALSRMSLELSQAFLSADYDRKRYATFQLERLDRQEPGKALSAATADEALTLAIVDVFEKTHYREAVHAVWTKVNADSPRVRAKARETWMSYVLFSLVLLFWQTVI